MEGSTATIFQDSAPHREDIDAWWTQRILETGHHVIFVRSQDSISHVRYPRVFDARSDALKQEAGFSEMHARSRT